MADPARGTCVCRLDGAGLQGRGQLRRDVDGRRTGCSTWACRCAFLCIPGHLPRSGCGHRHQPRAVRNHRGGARTGPALSAGTRASVGQHAGCIRHRRGRRLLTGARLPSVRIRIHRGVHRFDPYAVRGGDDQPAVAAAAAPRMVCAVRAGCRQRAARVADGTGRACWRRVPGSGNAPGVEGLETVEHRRHGRQYRRQYGRRCSRRCSSRFRRRCGIRGRRAGVDSLRALYGVAFRRLPCRLEHPADPRRRLDMARTAAHRLG